MSDVKAGFRSSEFWVQLVAHFAPMLAAYFMHTFCPDAPAATAAVAIVSAVAGHYSASEYSDDRSAVKQTAAYAIATAEAPAAPVAAPTPTK